MHARQFTALGWKNIVNSYDYATRTNILQEVPKLQAWVSPRALQGQVKHKYKYWRIKREQCCPNVQILRMFSWRNFSKIAEKCFLLALLHTFLQSAPSWGIELPQDSIYDCLERANSWLLVEQRLPAICPPWRVGVRFPRLTLRNVHNTHNTHSKAPKSHKEMSKQKYFFLNRGTLLTRCVHWFYRFPYS